MPNSLIVLDGFTLTPNAPGAPASDAAEPGWNALAQLAHLTVHPRTPADRVLERIGDARLALTNKTPITADTLRDAAQLQYVGVLATGVNVVDLDAAREHGVTVTNVPGYSSDSVAQHVFALLLELTNRVAAHADAVRQSRWARCEDFSFTLSPLHELAGRTMGIVGLGDIGQRVARIAAAMGMRVAAAHQSSMSHVSVPGVELQWMEHDRLFQEADVVTLHCPLNDKTRAMVNAQRLGTMKPSAYLINTGRGPLIDESALADALRARTIAGAALDVLSSEPPDPDNPLLTAPRCLITPHIAWASLAARQRLMHEATQNLAAFLKGEKRNVVA